ncbi:MAG: hypothetical protein ACLQNE_01655 [Thermoguttaceae bacterium]|jgi:hypothetical protein
MTTLLLTCEPTPIPTEDDLHLQSYEAKLQLVRDYTKGVALGFSNGFFLHGTGGIAKSYTVLDELQRLSVDFKLFNSRMSGRGLFEALAEYPAAVHVLEDMERVVKDKDAQGILRSACWGQRGEDGRQKRTITWATAKGVESVVFHGGIIMLSNRPLDDLPELRAIKTRISHLHLEVSDAEIAAQMRRLATKGYSHDGKEMTADECETVCDFVILESQSKLCHLDMRLLDNAFRDYLQWREKHATCHWQTLVGTRLDGRRDEFAVLAPKDRQQDEDLRTLEAVLGNCPTTLAAQIEWCRQRGKSRASFFRYKRALEERAARG